jgi:hypothetical protein
MDTFVSIIIITILAILLPVIIHHTIMEIRTNSEIRELKSKGYIKEIQTGKKK